MMNLNYEMVPVGSSHGKSPPTTSELFNSEESDTNFSENFDVEAARGPINLYNLKINLFSHETVRLLILVCIIVVLVIFICILYRSATNVVLNDTVDTDFWSDYRVFSLKGKELAIPHVSFFLKQLNQGPWQLIMPYVPILVLKYFRMAEMPLMLQLQQAYVLGLYLLFPVE